LNVTSDVDFTFPWGPLVTAIKRNHMQGESYSLAF